MDDHYLIDCLRPSLTDRIERNCDQMYASEMMRRNDIVLKRIDSTVVNPGVSASNNDTVVMEGE